MAAKTKSITKPTDKVATVGQVARTMAHILTLMGDDLKKRDERLDAMVSRIETLEAQARLFEGFAQADVYARELSQRNSTPPQPSLMKRGVSAAARVLSLWGLFRGKR